MKKYDLIVIGSGPAGEKAAVKAAYFLKKVAIIEKSPLLGGSATYYTVPSKALRELAVRSSKYKLHHDNILKEFITIKTDLMKFHAGMVQENLVNHGVDIYHGIGAFKDANHIEITNNSVKTTISGDNIIIAGGVTTLPPEDIPIDGKRIHIVETLLNISKIPASICIVGAGVIGCEYATIFSHFGCKVHLTDDRPGMLTRVDNEIVTYLKKHMTADGIDLQLGNKITEIIPPKNDKEDIVIKLENNNEIRVELLLIVGRRKSQLSHLHYDNAGIQIPVAKIIPVNAKFQTNTSNVYAVGDAIGPPGLVNTGMDQGRYAVSQMFGIDDMKTFSMSNMPQGIYTIPEISSVGITEEEAIQKKIDIVIGRAYHADIARGMIRGVEYGMLKLVIDKTTNVILGVHIIGDQASELIHFGVDLVVNKKDLKNIINSNFNFPCLHELYKYAAYDALGTITGRHMRVHLKSKIYDY